MRFNLDHAVFAILFMCSVQEHVLGMVSPKCLCPVVSLRTTLFISCTQVNRMSRSRRVLATGGKHCDYGWTGSVFIHFYFL